MRKSILTIAVVVLSSHFCFSQESNCIVPDPPQVTPQENLCEYDEPPVLHAEGENVKWYGYDKSILDYSILGEGNDYQTSDMTPGGYSYYATQTVDGCESEKVKLHFMVHMKPTNPIAGGGICEGKEGKQIILWTNVSIDKWYADKSATMYLAQGYNYAPDTSDGDVLNKTYYVRREQSGCVSDVISVKPVVVPKPKFKISNDFTMSIYEEEIPVVAYDFSPSMTNENVYGLKWKIKKDDIEKEISNIKEIYPYSEFKEEGEYEILASYHRYYYNDHQVNCSSDTMKMKFTVTSEIPINQQLQELYNQALIIRETRTVKYGDSYEDINEYTAWLNLKMAMERADFLISEYNSSSTTEKPTIKEAMRQQIEVLSKAINDYLNVLNQLDIDELSLCTKVYSLDKQIIIESSNEFTVQITDVTGKIIYQSKDCSMKTIVPISISGVYFVSVNAEIYTVVVK